MHHRGLARPDVHGPVFGRAAGVGHDATLRRAAAGDRPRGGPPRAPRPAAACRWPSTTVRRSAARSAGRERTSGVEGKCESGREDIGVGRSNKTKNKTSIKKKTE